MGAVWAKRSVHSTCKRGSEIGPCCDRSGAEESGPLSQGRHLYLSTNIWVTATVADPSCSFKFLCFYFTELSGLWFCGGRGASQMVSSFYKTKSTKLHPGVPDREDIPCRRVGAFLTQGPHSVFSVSEVEVQNPRIPSNESIVCSETTFARGVRILCRSS